MMRRFQVYFPQKTTNMDNKIAGNQKSIQGNQNSIQGNAKTIQNQARSIQANSNSIATAQANILKMHVAPLGNLSLFLMKVSNNLTYHTILKYRDNHSLGKQAFTQQPPH